VDASESEHKIVSTFVLIHHLRGYYPAIKTDENAQDISLLSQRQKQISSTMRTVRNLLRNDAGLSYESDRSSQLVWLLFLKNLDDFEQAQEALLGDDYIPIIEKGYRWRDWVVADSPAHRRKGDELLQFVNNDLIPYLSHLSGEDTRDIRTIIATIFRDTSNRIRSSNILREVVDKLNPINFNTSDDIHAISLFYETMLKEMHGSTRDVSEFYTPRPVVRFIIDRLQLQLGERLLDPACGTAGFLVEAYLQLVSLIRTTEQRKQLQDYLMGIEKKPLPYLLAIMNMLLHGIESPNIIQRNALMTTIRQIQDEDRVDVIAANPPFGGKEESSITYNFPEDMHTTDTSLLFVQFIMQMLKRPGGRCAVVLSNGCLFHKGAGSNIRRHLLTRFNLHTIVRLPPGVFSPSTVIPTNILFFEASQDIYNSEANPCTKEVWYYEISLPSGRKNYTKTKPIQDEDFQDCLLWWNHRQENEHAWKVPVEQLLANDCNLDYQNTRKNG
jgi:type I restriction enzyme M protein